MSSGRARDLGASLSRALMTETRSETRVCTVGRGSRNAPRDRLGLAQINDLARDAAHPRRRSALAVAGTSAWRNRPTVPTGTLHIVKVDDVQSTFSC